MTLNLSSTPSPSQEEIRDGIPKGVTICAATIGVILLVINATANGLLFKFVRAEQSVRSWRKTTAKTFILGITFFSLLSVFALFLDIILICCNHSPILLCNIVAFIHDHLLFLSFSFCAHFLTCITVERYTVINECKFQLRHHMRWFMPSLIIYVIVTWLAIFAEDFYKAFVEGGTYCYLPMYKDKYKGSVHSFLVAVVVVTIWQTSCNTITSKLTRSLIKKIRRHEKESESVLGMKVSKIETKRLKVTFALVVLFSVIWIPYGVQAILHSYVSIHTASSMFIIMRVTTHSTFIVLPVVYFKMERRFETFVKQNLLKRNKVNPSLA